MKSVKVAAVVARNRHAATPRMYRSDTSMRARDMLDGGDDSVLASGRGAGKARLTPTAAAMTRPATSSSAVAGRRMESANATADPAAAPAVAPAPHPPDTLFPSVM